MGIAKSQITHPVARSNRASLNILRRAPHPAEQRARSSVPAGPMPARSRPGTLATAFVFTTTDCPIANRYAPEIGRLQPSLRHPGHRLPARLREPARKRSRPLASTRSRFGYPMRSCTIAQHASSNGSASRSRRKSRLSARRRPALSRTHRRPLRRHRHRSPDADASRLRRRARALRSPADPLPRPPLERSAASSPTSNRSRSRTTSRRCCSTSAPSCHRPGGSAPFSLITYREARQRASLIAVGD